MQAAAAVCLIALAGWYLRGGDAVQREEPRADRGGGQASPSAQVQRPAAPPQVVAGEHRPAADEPALRRAVPVLFVTTDRNGQQVMTPAVYVPAQTQQVDLRELSPPMQRAVRTVLGLEQVDDQTI